MTLFRDQDIFALAPGRRAVQIVNELLPKKPIVIIGPSVAATCSAVSPLLARGVGPVNYCFSPVAVPPRGGYVFAATA